MASVVRRMSEVTLRRARLVLGWVTSQLGQLSLGVAKSSTGFGWGKGWNVTSAGWQVVLCDPIWQVSSSSGVSELLYPCYFIYLLTLLLCMLTHPRPHTVTYTTQVIHTLSHIVWTELVLDWTVAAAAAATCYQ